MTILITIERFVAICFPLRVSWIFTIKRTIRYTAGVFILSVLLNLPRWFEFFEWNYEASSPFWSSNSPPQLHRYPIYKRVFQLGIWYFTIYAIPLAAIIILNLLVGIQVKGTSLIYGTHR